MRYSDLQLHNYEIMLTTALQAIVAALEPPATRKEAKDKKRGKCAVL